MSRRTKAEIEADEAAARAWLALHARAAADHVRANPDTRYSAKYRALAEQAKGEV